MGIDGQLDTVSGRILNTDRSIENSSIEDAKKLIQSNRNISTLLVNKKESYNLDFPNSIKMSVRDN